MLPDRQSRDRLWKLEVGIQIRVMGAAAVPRIPTGVEGKLREVGEPLIDFGLREVGVDRQVGARPGRGAVKDVEAGVRLVMTAGIAAPGKNGFNFSAKSFNTGQSGSMTGGVPESW